MKKTWLRFAGIGLFHGVLYAFLVPFIIYPRFGSRGLTLVVVLSLIVTMALLWVRPQKGEKHD